MTANHADPIIDSTAAEQRRRRRAARLAQAGPVAPAPAAGRLATPSAHQRPGLVPAPTEPAIPQGMPPGVVEIPGHELARLQADAAAPERIAAERVRRDREAVVTAAVRAGRVSPHQGRQWLAVLEVDPAAAATLAAMPPNTAVPLNEIGHAGSGEDNDQRTGWF